MGNQELVELTAEIVSAHVSNNQVDIGEVGSLVQRVHEALASLGKEADTPPEKVPVVSVRASIKPDYLVCMECGAKQKMLKRHLQTAHGMTPAQYRQDYGLADSYPMVAANYSDRRRDLAKQLGLGRKPGEKPGARRGGNKGGAVAPTSDQGASPSDKPAAPRGGNKDGAKRPTAVQAASAGEKPGTRRGGRKAKATAATAGQGASEE